MPQQAWVICLCPCDCWSSTNVSSDRWSRWKHMSKNTKKKQKKRERENKREGKRTEWFVEGSVLGNSRWKKKHVDWAVMWAFQSGLQPVTPQITLRSKSKLLRRQSAPVPPRGNMGNVTSSRVMWIVTFVRMMTLNEKKKVKKTNKKQAIASVPSWLPFSHNADN